MKSIYDQILSLALPYYAEGRPGDVPHIRFHFRTAQELKEDIIKNGVDFDLVMALCLLHDVGYARVPKGSNPFDLEVRKLHSVEGAKIAEQIFIKT